MSPSETAAQISKAFAAAPGGKVGSVSKPTGSSYISPLDSIKGYLSVIGGAVEDVFAPSGINVPGAAPIASGLAKAAIKVGNEVGAGISKVSTSTSNVINSAATGVKTGFTWGIFAIVAIIGVWVWSVVKPR